MAQSQSPSVITEKLIQLTKDSGLGFQAVYYGLQRVIPKTPVVVVNTGPMEAAAEGTQHRTRNTFTVDLTIYHMKVSQNKDLNRKEADELAEALRDYLHQHKRLDDDLVYNSWVSRVTPGFGRTLAGSDLFEATNLTWTGNSLTNI